MMKSRSVVKIMDKFVDYCSTSKYNLVKRYKSDDERMAARVSEANGC